MNDSSSALFFLLLVPQLPYSIAYLVFTLTLPAQKAHCARTHISIITMSWSFYTTLDTGTQGATRTLSWQHVTTILGTAALILM